MHLRSLTLIAVALTSNVALADEGKILDRLEAKTTLKLGKTAPLKDVVDELQKLHGIPIVVDDGALSSLLLKSDVAVPAQFTDARFRSVLKRILMGRKLDWMIRDGQLVITSKEVAVQNPRVAIYTLDPLLSSSSDRRELEGVARSMIIAAAGKEQTGIYANTFRNHLIVSATEAGHASLNVLLHELVMIALEEKKSKGKLPAPKAQAKSPTVPVLRKTNPPSAKSLKADPFGLRGK